MKYWIWGLMVLLVLLRNDFWFWQNNFLVLGFAPVILVHQVVISLAAATLWFLAIQYCWPQNLESDYPDQTASNE